MKFGELIAVTIDEKRLLVLNVKRIVSDLGPFGWLVETCKGTPGYFFQNAGDDMMNRDVMSVHICSENEMEVRIR